MSCSHQSCACQVIGCGINHPPNWKPKMMVSINGVVVSGDDAADCMAHYMLQAGYPTDRPEHLRIVAERVVARRPPAQKEQPQ